MRIPDLIPLRPMPGGGPGAPARAAAGSPAGASAASAAGWLDAVAHEDAAAIVADPGAAPRAWSVEQHAARVLAALCGGPDGAP